MDTKNINIQSFLDQDEKKDLLRLLTAGSVDDGKSTLIGRLMYDSKMLYEDQLSALHKDSKRVGHAGDEIDYALLLDGLKAEREQGITIDVAYRYFSTNKRKFIIADTPGHEQYTRNMVTGASTANLAIILIDATKGVITQTKRHTYLVSLLGIKHIVLAVNKMDLVDYKQEVFQEICEKYKNFVTQLDISDLHCIPLSALKGENVVESTTKMSWYHGQSMLEYLENIHISSDRNFKDFRFPVQYALRPDRNFRGFSGKIESGIIKVGDQVMSLPSQKTSKVKSIVTYDGFLDKAFPPQSVTITLEDEIDISRGEMLTHTNDLPHIDNHFEAMLVWMDEIEMDINTQYYIKHTSNTTKARIDDILYKIDINSLNKSEKKHFTLNEIGKVIISTIKPLFFDLYKQNHATGSFVLIHPVTHNTVAVGMVSDTNGSIKQIFTDTDLQKAKQGESLLNTIDYEKSYNQKGVTVFINTLEYSKDIILQRLLEKKLFDLGCKLVVLNDANFKDSEQLAEYCSILNKYAIICLVISKDKYCQQSLESIIPQKQFIEILSNDNLVKKDHKIINIGIEDDLGYTISSVLHLIYKHKILS